jgi:hypothetical protein
MEVISIIVMFMFGNMNDQENQLTQYIPMESLSVCMKEVRAIKKNQTGFSKNAFCGPAIVEIKDGEVVALHTSIPKEATVVNADIDSETFRRWSIRAKERWNKK